MKRLLIGLFLILVPITAWSQSFLSYLYDQDSWPSGSWAEYAVENHVRGEIKKSRVRVAILGTEGSDEGTLYWLEIRTQTEDTRIDKMKVKMLKLDRETMKTKSPLREVIVQHNDSQAIRLFLDLHLPSPYLDALQGDGDAEPIVEEIAIEKLDLEAGQFETKQIRKTQKQTSQTKSGDYLLTYNSHTTVNAWLSDRVCTGVVQGREITNTSTQVQRIDLSEPPEDRGTRTTEIYFKLISYGDSGAESEIIGDPKDMGGIPGPPGPR